jgi:hypothetical protein
MHQIASDLNKAKRELFSDVVVTDWDHRDCSTGDNLQKDIFGWLSAPVPWTNHYSACKLRHPGTAEWFIHGNTFPEWRASEVPSCLLWVHGKRLSIRSFCGLTETYYYWFRSWRREKHFLVRDIIMFPSRENLS